MTTVASNVGELSSLNAIKGLQRYRAFNIGKPNGVYCLSWSKTLSTAETGDFNASGDFLEIFDCPDNARLISAVVTVPVMDNHATPAITLDLLAGSTVLTNNATAGQLGGDITYNGFENVSNDMLKLKIETVASTVPTTYPTAFSAVFLLYIGDPAVAS